MRRLFMVMMVATTTCLVPLLALGDNQEVANRIAANLRETGELTGQRIAVKFQNGIAELKGELRSQGQIDKALRVTSNTPGVQRIVSQLSLPTAKKPALTIPKLSLPTVKSLLNAVPKPTTPPAEIAAAPLAVAVRPAAPAPESGILATPAAPYSQQVSAPKAAPAPIPVAMLQDEAPAPAPVPVPAGQAPNTPVPMYASAVGGVAPAQYDQPHMPNYSWPSYASHPNYAALTYPKQYSPTAWPFIGPFYPYPQVPLGWRKVVLQWDDGWWFLDFIDAPSCALRP